MSGVFVGILTMGNQANIDRLLSPVFWAGIDPMRAHVVIINQGGPEIRVRVPHDDLRRFDLIQSEENLGAAGGRNLLVEFAFAHKLTPKYELVFLDDDVEVLRPDWLSTLLKPIWGNLADIVGVEPMRVTPDYLTRPVRNGEPMDYVSGGWCVISEAVFREGIRFDTRFNPVYWEDVDLCYQAREKGLRIAAVSGESFRHVHTGQGDADLFNVNRRKFQQKWG